MNPPDWEHIIKLAQKSISSRGIGQQSSRKSLHGNESHICLPAFFHKFQLVIRSQIAKRKLERFIQSAVNSLMSHLKPVIGNSDMTDLPLCLCFQHRFIQPASVFRLRTEGRVMELVKVHIVCAESFQRLSQILPKIIRRQSHCLCCQVNLIPHSVKGLSKLLFTVRIESGRVKEVHASPVCPPQKRYCRILANSLNGQGSETVFINFYSCASKCYLNHAAISLVSFSFFPFPGAAPAFLPVLLPAACAVRPPTEEA